MENLKNLILNDNGKDDRLKILENGMTKYGCKPYPYSHLSYSSCTASTISLEAFVYLEEYLKRTNLNDKEIYLKEFQNIRDDIRKIIGLKDDVDICLGSSGTDLEMLPYLFIPFNSKVNNIIIGPNEVGSGTLLAADGRVFSNMSENFSYQKGDKLEDFDKFNINLVNIPIRNEEGKPFDDEYFLNKINNVLKSDKETYNIYFLDKDYNLLLNNYHLEIVMDKTLAAKGIISAMGVSIVPLTHTEELEIFVHFPYNPNSRRDKIAILEGNKIADIILKEHKSL